MLLWNKFYLACSPAGQSVVCSTVVLSEECPRICPCVLVCRLDIFRNDQHAFLARPLWPSIIFSSRTSSTLDFKWLLGKHLRSNDKHEKGSPDAVVLAAWPPTLVLSSTRCIINCKMVSIFCNHQVALIALPLFSFIIFFQAIHLPQLSNGSLESLFHYIPEIKQWSWTVTRAIAKTSLVVGEGW